MVIKYWTPFISKLQQGFQNTGESVVGMQAVQKAHMNGAVCCAGTAFVIQQKQLFFLSCCLHVPKA